MDSKLGSIVLALMQMKSPDDPAYSFEPENGNTAQALNSAFLITLAGMAHPEFERAENFLESLFGDPEWKPAADFYIKARSLLRTEISHAFRENPGFAEKFARLSEWTAHRENLADLKNTAEKFWDVFFPEAGGLLDHREKRIEELRSKRRVSITRLNPRPLKDPGRELLFSANVLLTLPLEVTRDDDLSLSNRAKEKLSRTRREGQLFWYDHPIPLGVEAEKNEALYGLRGLDKALEFERRRGNLRQGIRPVCLLSVSVTHGGLRPLVGDYIRGELARSGGLNAIDLYAFTEADSQKIISEILAPAAAHYLGEQDAAQQLAVFGVDGEYGRHYSFLKALPALWQVLVDPGVKATFKIDLDQVFPQEELVAETGHSAFEHFQTPLWGAEGVDNQGKPVDLGMIAGALVNEKDIGRSLFSVDVPFPDGEPSVDELFFFSALPQALSTEGEMTVRYDRDDLDGQRACLQRVHVTGGTNGILVDSLRRHRPFTPSFIGRAEDQAYILSAFMNPDPRLAYVHKDGLIMRHDKETFAQDAIASAFVGKLIGDYVRIITFSAYAGVLTDDIRALKDLIDPFTGCFVSFVPATVVSLRFAFKAASLFASGKADDGAQFVREGTARLGKALDFASGNERLLERTYVQERSGWKLFYDTLTALEQAVRQGDPFGLGLQRQAQAIIGDCAISAERSF